MIKSTRWLVPNFESDLFYSARWFSICDKDVKMTRKALLAFFLPNSKRLGKLHKSSIDWYYKYL